jgi:hypothetical protein
MGVGSKTLAEDQKTIALLLHGAMLPDHLERRLSDISLFEIDRRFHRWPRMRAEASHVAKLKKLIEETSRRHNTWQVFQDFVAMSAISIRNAVDFRGREAYEELYLSIVKRYDREEIEILSKECWPS